MVENSILSSLEKNLGEGARIVPTNSLRASTLLGFSNKFNHKERNGFCKVHQENFGVKMTFEVELKARLRNPDAIKTKAAQMGSLKKETLKEDVYFRPKGDTSAVPADRYRLRREGKVATVTFKQKIIAGGTEVNRETEFTVDNAHAFFQFAERYGFEPFVVKRKKSRTYQVGRASVELNDVEHLGCFIEIEILCEEESEIAVARTEIARLFTQLGLSSEDLEPRFYIDMLQQAHPAGYRFVDNPRLDWPFEEIA